MIHFLNLNKFKRGLRPVTSTEIFSKPGEFHPEGLFSEVIFGAVESLERKKTFSYINLYAEVIHPEALLIIIQLDKRIENFISASENFSVDKSGKLIIDPDGVTGLRALKELFPKIVFRGESATRESYIKKLKEAYKEDTLFIDAIPVIPPILRDIFQDQYGMWRSDAINDYYISLMRKAIQIKNISKGSPLYNLLNYELQRAVVEHDNYIRKKIQKKSGLIRTYLLGKRTEFSGRAVITPGPELKVNEIGIPLRLAISLFEPFIIFRVFRSGQIDIQKLEDQIKNFTKLEFSLDSLKIVFKAIKSGDKVPDDLYNMIFEITEVVMKDRVVLAKRDPVLHAESVRAFKPILIHGNTIKLSTLQVKGFNADFDGDAMAVFHPITDEAQLEVKTKMLRSETGETVNSVNFDLSKEMLVGLYILTKNIKKSSSPISVSEKDLEEATDPYIPVTYRGKHTTMGKAIFNSCFPASFSFYDDLATGKAVNSLIPQILSKYGQEKAIETFSKLKDYGFKFATISSPSLSLNDIELPESILKLKDKLKGASTEEADLLIKKMQDLLEQHLKDTGLYDLVKSGAGKGWDQVSQILVAKGLISDPQGKILEPITSSFADGLSNQQYFNASAGSRTGIIDRVLNTSESGYMSRQLAFILNSVELHRQLIDCKTKRTIDLRLTNELISKLNGRFIIKGNTIHDFKQQDFKSGDIINLRTPIYCESPKICHTCYGKLLERHKSPYAGILAAQVIGEAGTQTIMRTFHTGGAVKLIKKDLIEDIVQNDPLVTREIVKKHLSVTENTLIALKPCVITIEMEDYPIIGDDIFIDEDESVVYVKGLVCKAEFEDVVFNIILDYPVQFQIYEMQKIGKEQLKLKFQEGSTILETFLEASIMKQQLLYIKRLLSGREIYKDPAHLLMKMFKIYGPITKGDLVHLEILLSQCLRDASNISLPARLGKKWDPVMINIKDIVFNTSFIQGLGFENINKAIHTGLINEEVGEESILEQIMTGTLVRKK
jgi:DNA-directed RNA polymerase beta' subunit